MFIKFAYQLGSHSAILLLVASVALPQTSPQKSHLNLRNWQDLSGNETLANSRQITDVARNSVLNRLAAEYKAVGDAKTLAAGIRIKLIDLNSDGTPEIVAQGTGSRMCSPTGNCSFWIFKKTTDGYHLILEKGSVQTLTIQNTRTNGFSDMLLGMHGSAFEQTLFLYQYRNGRYSRTGCYNANWQYLGKDGEYHDLKEPHLSRCER